MNTTKTVYAVVTGIMLVLLTVAFFLLWEERDGIFWTTYLFEALSVVLLGGNAFFRKKDDRHFAANFGLVTVSVLYLLFCAGWSLFGVRAGVGITVYGVVHTILLGTFTMIYLLTLVAIRHINSQDK